MVKEKKTVFLDGYKTTLYFRASVKDMVKLEKGEEIIVTDKKGTRFKLKLE